MTEAPADEPITVDGTGMLCVALLLHLRKHIDGRPPGTLVHVIATDPAAPLDLPAWCHLTGHAYLGLLAADNGEAPTYAVRLTARPAPTHPDAPWHAASPSSRARGNGERFRRGAVRGPSGWWRRWCGRRPCGPGALR